MPLASRAIEAGTDFQIGKETTPGTAVAATNKLLVSSLSIDPGATVRHGPRTVGVLAPYGVRSVTRKLAELRVSTPVSFEQVLYYFLMGLKGGVTGTGLAAPYTWTFDPSETADPAPTTFTVERRLKDMLATPGYDDIRVEYCFARQLVIRGSEGEDSVWELEADIVGRQVSASTFTAGIAVPTVEDALVYKTTVYINDTWAALGTTPVLGQILDFTWTFDTGLLPLFTPDGNLYFSSYSFGGGEGRARGVTIELTMLCSTQMATERTKAQAQANRFVRLSVAGSDDRAITLDAAVVHESGDIATVDARDGLHIVSMRLVPIYDSTGAAHVKAVVKNNLQTLP